MNLAKIAAAANGVTRPNHSILIYGPPKTGKTELVGTAAKIEQVNKILWFDLEKGAETLLHMGLTDAEMAKIELVQIPDLRDMPRAIETMLKVFSAKTDVIICDGHGKVNCLECRAGTQYTGTTVNINKMTHQDLVVIDSGSQLGDSALNLACLGKDIEFKPGWDEYGLQSKYLADILTVIQASAHTNFIVLTHILPIEEDYNGIKRDKFYPLMGTKAFSQKVAKYFGTVILAEIKLGKHMAGSSSTYKTDYITGSRVNAKLDGKAPDMKEILIAGGILK